MNYFIRAANGWDITKRSFRVLESNKQLILLPLLTGISLFILTLSLSETLINTAAWEATTSFSFPGYLNLFVFYLAVFFVVVFFNTALSYCIHSHFTGQKTSIIKGLAFSVTHFFSIMSWALFAATIGSVLRVIQNRVGLVGQVFRGIMGSIPGIATYFVVPIITYENIGPISALKKSKKAVKEKWGETVGAAFNFIFIQFIALIFLAIIAITIGTVFNALTGFIVALLGVVMLIATVSAARIIFLSAVYQNVKGNHADHFEQDFLNQLIIKK